MTWFKVDDGFGEHRKVDALGADTPHALCVWLLCGNASGRALTDGVVSEAMLARSCSALSPAARRKAADALVRVGLWEKRSDGWAFHDWLDHQPSRAVVRAEREQARERQRKHRASKAGVSHAVTSAVTDAVTSPSVTGPRPDPSRPDQKNSDAPAGEPETRPDTQRPIGPAARMTAMNETARRSVEDAARTRGTAPPQACSYPDAREWCDLSRWALEVERTRPEVPAEEALAFAVAEWLSTDAAKHGFSPQWLAKNPNEYFLAEAIAKRAKGRELAAQRTS